MPKLSIIVPVYNVENYLGECIESILRQTFSDLELMLVDDGSTDRSGEICDEYAAKDERIRVFHRKNSGIAVSRNVGLRESKGEYVTFVDSDDLLSLDTYEICMDRLLNDCTIDVVQFPFVRYDGKNEYPVQYSYKKEIIGSEEILCNVWSGSPINYSVWGKVFKRKAIEGIYFDEACLNFEDCLFIYETYKHIGKYLLIDEGRYMYRTGGQVTSNMTFQKYYDMYSHYNHYYSDMQLYNGLAQHKGVAFNRMYRHLISAQMQEPSKRLDDDYKKLDKMIPTNKEIAMSPKETHLWLYLAKLLGTKRLTKLYICYINKIKRTHC